MGLYITSYELIGVLGNEGGVGTYGSSLYISCPSSDFSCTNRSSSVAMMSTKRASRARSSGLIIC